MLAFGILLIVVAALAVVGAVFTIDGGSVEYFGIGMPPVALVVIGAATMLLIWLGMGLIRVGTRRSLRARKEHKRLQELDGQQDRVEGEPGPGAQA